MSGTHGSRPRNRTSIGRSTRQEGIGAKRIYFDKESGANTNRPGLHAALNRTFSEARSRESLRQPYRSSSISGVMTPAVSRSCSTVPMSVSRIMRYPLCWAHSSLIASRCRASSPFGLFSAHGTECAASEGAMTTHRQVL